MKTIDIIYDPKTGEIKTEANGYEGQSCLEATKPLEDAFGAVTNRGMKTDNTRIHTTQKGNHVQRTR